MRSSVVPQTIASETAQNTNWKNRSAAGLMFTTFSSGMSLAAEAASCPTLRKKPCVPAIAPAPPNASANPHAQYAIEAIEKLSRIFATPAPAFFMREKPISSSAKPACMNITSTPATITQVVLTLDTVSDRVGPAAAEAAPGTANAAASTPRQAASDLLRAESSGAAPVARFSMNPPCRAAPGESAGVANRCMGPRYAGLTGASLATCRKYRPPVSPYGREAVGQGSQPGASRARALKRRR